MNAPQTLPRPAFVGGSKGLLIGGKWQEAASGKQIDTINPATGEVIARIADGEAADVDRAVQAARAAFEGEWSCWTPYQRQRLLLQVHDVIEKNFDELAMIETLDMGAPYVRTKNFRTWVSQAIMYYASQTGAGSTETRANSMAGHVQTLIYKAPVGVVGGIIPWNGPLMGLWWIVGPTLATGCTAILKPAEDASLSALRVGELLVEAGVPDGVINIVTGFGGTAGAALAEHPGVDRVAFTGSVETARKIVYASSSNMKRLQLELGGKSPDIVFADADLKRAVTGAGMGVFANSGQACSAGTRIFVERPIYDEFVDAVAELATTLTVGNSLDPTTRIGPVVSEEQLARVSGYLDIGRDEGARTVAGGHRVETGDLADGYFVAPTVFADVADEMRVAREEIFGPVACVLPFDSIDEVVARSNATSFGLAGGVWTRDVGKAHRLANDLRTGTVWVNTYNLFDPAVPFGGHKMSGWGHECGPDALDEYLSTKAVWIRTD